MTSNMREQPEGLEELNVGYSNFNHELIEGIEEKLKAGNTWCDHAAWDHWGAIWYEDKEFHERVMVYQAHVATVSGETLKQVVDTVNERFGGD